MCHRQRGHGALAVGVFQQRAALGLVVQHDGIEPPVGGGARDGLDEADAGAFEEGGMAPTGPFRPQSEACPPAAPSARHVAVGQPVVVAHLVVHELVRMRDLGGVVRCRVRLASASSFVMFMPPRVVVTSLPLQRSVASLPNMSEW